MKLRAIEIVGFKSFRDRVRMEIGDGMTGIVGPNGCGKSNVVDAIKWAMGDMSPKSLRGDSMQDVIFAGTERRKPTGMAEVTLTFENPAADEVEQLAMESDDGSFDLGDSIPREFQRVSEIAITRRVYRDGQGEYFINKVACRLRDIQNLLAGTGLGKQGYSIIEQGQIGFIVNARPEERRLIIEEASGITRYKDQRRRAERKLERTSQNLQRTRDILDEIEKQLQVLEKQAEKAREFKEIHEELQGLEIALLLAKRHQAAVTFSDQEGKLKQANAQSAEARTKLEAVSEQLQTARVDAHQADGRHGDLRENFYKVETRLNLSRSNREHSLESIELATSRGEELVADRRRQEERREHYKAELLRVREELNALADQPTTETDEVERIESELDAIKAERAQVARSREETQRRLDDKRSTVERLTDRKQWIEAQIEELKQREDAGKTAFEEATEESVELGRAISRLTIDYETATREIEARNKAVDAAAKRLTTARERFKETEEQEEALARRRVELSTRIDSLEALRRSGEGYAEGVRRILEWAREEGRVDILGPAGDFLEVPEGQEAAVAAYLGDRLSDILVTSREGALEALAMLASEDAGRVACYPVADPKNPAEALAGWLEGLEIVERLEDVPQAMEPSDIQRETKAWATLKGDVIFSDGRVVGGGVGEQAENLLRQARELEEMKSELAEVEAAHGDAKDALVDAREEAMLADEELTAVRESLQEATHRARGLRQEQDNEVREKQRVDKRLVRLEEETAKTEERKQALWEEHRERGRRIEEIATELPLLEEEVADLEKEVTFLDESIEVLGAKHTERKVRVAQADERRRHLQESCTRFEEGIAHADKEIERFRAELSEQEDRREQARVKAEALAGEVERLEKDHKTIAEEAKAAKVVLDDAVERVSALELAVLARRQDLDEAQSRVQSLELARREAELAMEHVTEQLEERFEIDLAEAQRRALLVELAAPERKGRAEYLKKRLRRIGTVNPLAIEEFEESKQRHEFHATQQADLESSVADLRKAIDRMDAESRKRFAETFEAVDAKFQEVFPRLFRGGRARLTLTDPKDLLNTGVDIEVQPPGKKLQNVTLLSGGEKALTAVSLIFSIFLLKPTPFSVLDEVDAPLDDANVGRFAEMVRDLSQTSQMIVITHNRRTMEAPQRLYGVTMEEAGISKLVSVKLSDAHERLAS